ncbi:some similarities with uniprot [Nakaseomyces bracarensis]|uniref:Some similarities with uniprot n=1 Tax=Nakaseomyces bracarensis TaxID=273131 RepID=A0ABR4NPA8_9SACH
MLVPHVYFLVYALVRSISYVSAQYYPKFYPNGCLAKAKITKGLTMELYEYPYLNPIVECSDGTLNCREYDTDDLETDACVNDNFKFANYPRYGYKEQRLIAKVEGVAGKTGEGGTLDFDINADTSCVPQLNTLPVAYNYKPEIHTTNFSMLLYGYFKPQISGVHTFTMLGDTEALMSFSDGQAFTCCNYNETANDFGDYYLHSINGNSASYSAHLYKDVYYPIRIFYLNADKRAQFKFSFKTNDNLNFELKDLSPYLFSMEDTDEGCPHTRTYKAYANTDITQPSFYSTHYSTLNSQTTFTTYYVRYRTTNSKMECYPKVFNPWGEEYFGTACVPHSQVFTSTGFYTTTTRPGTGSLTTTVETIATATYTTYEQAGTLPIPETIIVVETPIPRPINTTFTIPGTNILETTLTTLTTNTVGTDSKTTPVNIIIIETPTYTPTYSEPPAYTTTLVDEANSSSETDVVSFFPTLGSDGKTHTATTTYPWSDTDAYSEPSPSTTVVTKDSTTETDVVSYFPTLGSDGKTHTGSTTYTVVDTDSFSEPPAYTTTLVDEANSSSETDVVSFFPTLGSDGKTHTGSTTYTVVDTDSFSEPSPSTTVVTKDSTTETDVVSYFPTLGSDGKTHTGSTTYTVVDTDSFSEPPAYTTTLVDEANSSSETDVVSFFPTLGSDGKTHTATTTYPWSDTDAYSEPSPSTTVVTKDSTTETDVVSYFPTLGSDGKTHTGSTTYTLANTDTFSEPSASTTVITSGSSTETDVISYFPTVGSDGKTHTGATTYTLANTDTFSEPSASTTVITSGSSTETDVISYFPTVGSDGKTHTGATTYTLANTDTFSEPSASTTVITSGSSTETDVISYFPTVGSDGKTHTGSTTYTLGNNSLLPEIRNSMESMQYLAAGSKVSNNICLFAGIFIVLFIY